MPNLKYNNIHEEAQFMILDFLNSAQSFDELTDSPKLQGHPVISSLIALRILEKRELCSDRVFTSLSDLEGIIGFDQEKLNDLAYALSHDPAQVVAEVPDLAEIGKETTSSDIQEEEIIELEEKDIGSLETVLRTYYLSQIKSLEGRKNRKLARQLIEYHLVLPKSQQRTSKDQAYIKEILGIERPLLSRLENTRLIRRFTQRGKTPIYEVSHDSLVEPILAERRNKETVGLFLKKWGKFYLLALGFLIFAGWYWGHILKPPKYEKIMLAFQELPIYVDPAQLIEGKYLEVPGSIKIDNRGEHDVRYEFLRRKRNGDLAATGDGEGMSKKIKANLHGDLKLAMKSRCVDCTEPSGSRRTINLGSFEETSEDSVIRVNMDKVYNLKDFFSARIGQSAKEFLEKAQVRIHYDLTAHTLPKTKIQIVKEEVAIPEYQPVEFIEVNYPNGRVDRIPLGVKVSPNTTPAGNATARLSRGGTTTSNSQASVHIVAKGETLFSIARKYGTTVADLKARNGLNGQAIKIGQAIRLK